MIHFVPIKDFDVETRAKNRGFTKKINLWNRKLNKYARLFGDDDSKNRPPWYHYRKCANYGGLPPIAHNPTDAKVLVNNPSKTNFLFNAFTNPPFGNDRDI